MNPDRLSMVPAHGTLQTAFACLDGAQSHPTEQQVMGAAILFQALCEELRLDPGQMLDAARRVKRHAQEHYSIELQALHNYIRHEIRNAHQ